MSSAAIVIIHHLSTFGYLGEPRAHRAHAAVQSTGVLYSVKWKYLRRALYSLQLCSSCAHVALKLHFHQLRKEMSLEEMSLGQCYEGRCKRDRDNQRPGLCLPYNLVLHYP